MENSETIQNFIRKIPKAELHVHLEGTIEPEMMFGIADRNGIKIPYKDVESLRSAYHFKDLKDFLILYNEGTKILQKPIDFFDITMAYLNKAHADTILHTELFIDFQTYLRRGIAPDVQMEGILAALTTAKKEMGISTGLILCFLRHLGPRAAERAYPEVVKFREHIVGIGLASTEIGHPPEDYQMIFDQARRDGFKTVAHAGEEGPWEYVKNSIEYLKVDRIDHGNKSCQNPELAKRIARDQIPLTICPLSNIKLKNVPSMEQHTVKKMLDMGMMVTINSDDPAYFGGYINENILLVHEFFNLSKAEIVKLARNSFEASFISLEEKKNFFKILDEFAEKY